MVPQLWGENSSGKVESSDFTGLSSLSTQTSVGSALVIGEVVRRRKRQAW